MDRAEFDEWTRAEDIRVEAYAIGEERDDCLCALPVAAGDWVVFSSDRGQRWDLRQFSSESAALAYLRQELDAADDMRRRT